MGFLDLFKKRSIENPSVSISDALGRIGIIGLSASGMEVSESSALRFSGVYAGVKIISETLATLSLKLYKKTESGKEEANQDDLFYLLKDSPNDYQTSFNWREIVQYNAIMGGNGVSVITRDARGQAINIRNYNSRIVTPLYLDNQLKAYKIEGIDSPVLSQDVIHIQSMTKDGYWGVGLLEIALEAVGQGLAMQDFGSRLFKNGANMSGVLSHPSVLSDKARENLKKSVSSNYEGNYNAHKTMILEEGMKYERISITPQEAQLLEGKRFQIEEIARVLRMPPHMLADLSRSTNNNIEHQSLEFVMYCIHPWVKRWEQELNKKLLSNAKKKEGYFIKFNLDTLLRGDIKTRTEHYAQMLDRGVYSPNEVREMEDWNKREGGDSYRMPMNFNVEQNGNSK
jgi:HK97 family phage portal protein